MNSGNIMQWPAFQKNLKYFPSLMKLKCVHVYHIISGANAYLKFIKWVGIRILEKLKTSTQWRLKMSRRHKRVGLTSSVFFIFKCHTSGQMRNICFMLQVLRDSYNLLLDQRYVLLNRDFKIYRNTNRSSM